MKKKILSIGLVGLCIVAFSTSCQKEYINLDNEAGVQNTTDKVENQLGSEGDVTDDEQPEDYPSSDEGSSSTN